MKKTIIVEELRILQRQVDQECPKDAKRVRIVIFSLQRALLDFFEDFIIGEEFRDLEGLSSMLNLWPAYLKEKEREEGFPPFCSSYKCYEEIQLDEEEMVIWIKGLYGTIKIARIKGETFSRRKGVRRN